MTRYDEQPLKVLIVDDTSTNRLLAESVLNDLGHEATTVESGEAALSALASKRFDLMLLDVIMPGLDGYEVCRKVRRRIGASEMPIVLLSGLDDQEEVQQEGFAVGASAVMSKPVEAGRLNDVLASLD